MIVPIGALAEVGPAADLVRIAWSTCTTDSQTLTGTTDGLRRSRDGYASPIVVALAFADPHSLARELAATLMKIEQVPDSPMFRQNTAAFIYYLPDGALSNAEGQSNYVRVQVLTNAGALNRDKQLAVVRQFTDLVAAAAGDPSFTARTWVLLTEAIEGGWGLAGHANTNAELVDAARAQIAELQKAKGASG